MRLIDADALKEKVEAIIFGCSFKGDELHCELNSVLDYIINTLIDGAPTMGGWIPCSERLPEPLEEVMITWVNNSPPSYYSHMKGVPQTDEAVYFCGDWYWWDSSIVDVLGEYGKMRGIEPIKGIDITAWMPLPAPHKEETGE